MTYSSWIAADRDPLVDSSASRTSLGRRPPLRRLRAVAPSTWQPGLYPGLPPCTVRARPTQNQFESRLAVTVSSRRLIDLYTNPQSNVFRLRPSGDKSCRAVQCGRGFTLALIHPSGLTVPVSRPPV